MMKSALLLSLSTIARGLECAPGYMSPPLAAQTTALGYHCADNFKKEEAQKKYIVTVTNIAARVDYIKQNTCIGCCIVNPLTCGGLRASVACGPVAGLPAQRYQNRPSGKAELTYDAKATTVAKFQTDCCADKATCATASACTAGKKKIANKESTVCDGGPDTCASKCCENDPLLCGTYTSGQCMAEHVLGHDFYKMKTSPSRASTAYTTWAALATTATKSLLATTASGCCVLKHVCSATGYTCAAGTKKATVLTGSCDKCSGSSTTCPAGDYDIAGCATTSTCCVDDTTLCGTGGTAGKTGKTGITCGADKVRGVDAVTAAKAAGTAVDSTSVCCVAKPAVKAVVTCATSGWDVAAGMKKTTAQTAPCTKNSYNILSYCPSLCTEKDVLKCGGLSGIVCAKGSYKPTSDNTAAGTTKMNAWKNLAAKEATKNTDCCWATTTCKEFEAVKKMVGSSALVNFSGHLRPGAAILLALVALIALGQK